MLECMGCSGDVVMLECMGCSGDGSDERVKCQLEMDQVDRNRMRWVPMTDLVKSDRVGGC